MLKLLDIDPKTLKDLVRIAVPMVISQGSFAVMIFTDRYFLSMIDPVNMAAALGGGVASFFCLSLFIGVLSYANALVAQYMGAGTLEKCTRTLTQGLILTALSAPLLFVIAYFVGDLFQAMGHDPRQVSLEKIYFYTLMLGSVITLAKICIASYFSGIGRTRQVMIADVLGMALNIPLSYALIFGKLGLPELGIVGAGIGTIVGTLFSLLLFVYFYFQREHRIKFKVMSSFKYDRKILRRFVRLGFPSGLELFLNVAAFNLFLLMFQSYGIVEAASVAIVFNWDILSFIPMIGLNIGIISLIGRYVGANDISKATQAIRSGFFLGFGYSGALMILFFVFRTQLVEIFVMPGADGTAILELTSDLMIFLSTYVMADAIILVAGGVLRGAGDTRWLMLTSVPLHWAMLIAQYLVIKVLDFGPRASFAVFVMLIFAIAFVYVARLRGNKWRHPEALKKVMAEA